MTNPTEPPEERDSLAEIEERLARTTRSNWSVDWNSPKNVIAEDGSGEFIAGTRRADDAEFIAHAPEDIRRLLDEVEALRASLALHVGVQKKLIDLVIHEEVMTPEVTEPST